MEDSFKSVHEQGQQSQAQIAPVSWRQLSIHTYIKAFIVAVLFYLLFYRDIGSLVYTWQGDSSWSHGFLIPLFSLYFIHHRKEEILAVKPKSNYLGLFLMIAGFILYTFNLSIPSLRIGYASPLLMIGILGSIVLLLGGGKLLKVTFLPIAFLIFAVPLPPTYYAAMTMPMQKLAAEAATAFLNLFSGIDATLKGITVDIVYNGQRIEPSIDVAEACSGMRLLMAFVALGVAMAYLYQRPLWQKFILLAATIPIAVLCNVIRVIITAFIYVFINQEYAQGAYHDMLGLAMLPLAFFFYWVLDLFFSKLFTEEESDVKEDVIIRKK
jgi:exosortase